MLEENKALRMRLHSLTIFRGLLEDPVVSRLAALLHAQPSDAEACADAYCAFAAALYERGGDLSTYLLKAVLEDENLYVRRAASGAPIPAELAECLQHELCFLQELSQFDGASLRGALKGAFLPRWGTQTLDFAARYEENIRTLPLHGYGIYAKYHVFTVHSGAIVPVRHPDPQRLDELSGAALTLLDNSRQQLRQAAVTLKMGSSDRMHDQQLQLGRLHGDLIRLTGQVVYRGLADLRNLDVRLSQASRYNLAACTQNLDAMQGVLALRSTELLQTQRQQLAWLGDRVAARDPRRMLEMGFAMVRSGGRHITSVGDVQPGVEITVLWRDGSADAEIKRLHPTGKSSRKENDKLK